MDGDPYRTPGVVEQPLPDGWTRCAGCRGAMSPWHNCRRRHDGKILCVPCSLVPALKRAYK